MSSLYTVVVENPYLSFLQYEPITPNPCYRLQIHGKVLERWQHLIKLRIIIYIFVVLLDIKKVFVFLVPPVGTVATTYNRRFISVFFWILFRKIFSPALCYIWEIGKPYALDNYNTEGIWFLEFWYDVSSERSIFSKIISNSGRNRTN